MSEKMTWHSALVEWESCGLDDIPTENLNEFIDAIMTEINRRNPKGILLESTGVNDLSDSLEFDDTCWSKK